MLSVCAHLQEGKYRVRDCGCKYAPAEDGDVELCPKHKAEEGEADEDLKPPYKVGGTLFLLC